MKSAVQRRKQLVSDAHWERTARLLDLLPDMIAKNARITRSTLSRDPPASASARTVLTGCLRQLAPILKKNACSSVLVACGPLRGLCHAFRARLGHSLRWALNQSATAELAVQEHSLALKANRIATSARPELGVHQQAKSV